MGEELEVTFKDIANIRAEIDKYIEENGRDLFYAEDVYRLQNEDDYVIRFCRHVNEVKEKYVEAAIEMIISTFKWRMQFGTKDLNDNTISDILKAKGALYVRNRDKDGKKLLIFSVRKHIKGADSMIEMKKFFIYFLERIDREDNGDQVTIFFDCTSGGIKNMDIEFVQYMINILKNYYPWCLNYVLIFEMPWALNAAWKIIKTMLPEPAVKKTKFLTKSNINDYIDEDQCLVSWGGTDDWTYEFLPEVQKVAVSSAPEEERIRAVSFSSEVKDNSYSSSPLPKLIRVSPVNEINFLQNGNEYLRGKVQIWNIFSKPVIFKIKITSPEKYKVRPSIALLLPDTFKSIEISVQSSMIECHKDRFLITTLETNEVNLSNSQIAEIMKNSEPNEEYRLRCRVDASVVLPSKSMFTTDSSSNYKNQIEPSSAKKSEDIIIKKMNQLSKNQREIIEEIALIKNMLKMTIIFSAMTIFLKILGYI